MSRDDALAYVFGYVPLLDITMRGDEDRSFRKSFDTFTPIGPAIVTADDVPDPDALELVLRVNGEVRQSANTRQLIYGVAHLVELYSAAMTLEPGDLIATGTPEGVGPIVGGDRIEFEHRERRDPRHAGARPCGCQRGRGTVVGGADGTPS